jgi:hypothetical protein
MDLHSRRILGQALGETLELSLFTEALERALCCRCVNLDDLMIRTDHGRHSTGKGSQQCLVEMNIHLGFLARAIAETILLLRASLQS